MDVGKRIIYLRVAKGLTTTGLAYRAGLSQSHLRDIELGNKNPTIDTITYICDGLDISLADLFSQEIENNLKDDELLRVIYRLNKDQRRLLLQFIESLWEK